MSKSKFQTWNTGGMIVEPSIQRITKDFDDSDLDEMIQAVMAIKYDRIYSISMHSMTKIGEQIDNVINSLENYKDIEYVNCHKKCIEQKLKLLIESIDRYKTSQQSVKDYPDRS